jgi:hypothetical protein
MKETTTAGCPALPPPPLNAASKCPLESPGFVLALTGIRRISEQFKAIETDDLIVPAGRVERSKEER